MNIKKQKNPHLFAKTVTFVASLLILGVIVSAMGYTFILKSAIQDYAGADVSLAVVNSQGDVVRHIDKSEFLGRDSYLRLVVAVLSIISIIVLIAFLAANTMRKNYQKRVQKIVYYDSLTGLPNYNFAREEIQTIIESSRGKTGFALCLLNIANFKKINDVLGYEAGDKLLCQIAAQFEDACNENCVIARFDRDEFLAIIRNNPTMDFVKDYLDKLNLLANNSKIYGQNFTIHLNGGIAMYPQHGSSLNAILRNVGMAKHHAKEAGKNTFIIFNESMTRDMLERVEMETAISEAVKDKEFELYYQPQVDGLQHKIKGLEALIRWNSPVYGYVPPNKFIPIAEQTGMITELGQWIIKETFKFAKSIENTGICVSCNVSAVQLLQTGFIDTVVGAFKEYGLKRGAVSIEITESCLIGPLDEVVGKLRQIQDSGILIYLDDFGTGYSSLNYLKSLPINVVKIDKSFIDDIVHDKAVRGIFKAIVSMADELGLLVVCEGVETKEQADYLLRNGCGLIQGYYYSKPLPKNETIDFIANFA